MITTGSILLALRAGKYPAKNVVAVENESAIM
jgi:hypothetical protein